MRSRSLLLAASVLWAPAVAGAQPYVYVSGAAADAIGVVDLQTNTVVGTLSLPGLPSGAAVGSAGKLFVARSRMNSVAMIDPVSGEVTSIPVGVAPAGMAVAVPGTGEPVATKRPPVFVANGGSDTVSVINSVVGAVVTTIPVGDAPLDVAAAGARVYVANFGDGTVSVIDALTNAVVGTVPVGRLPAGLAVDPFTGRAYVANFFDDTVSVIDPASLSVVATIPVARGPRALAVDPVAGRLYVAAFDEGVVEVVDTTTNAVVLQAGSGGTNPTDLLLGPAGERLYVAHLQAGENVRVLQAATLQPLASIAAPDGPVGLAGFGSQAPTLERAPGALRTAVDEIRSATSQLVAGTRPVSRPGRRAAPEGPTEVIFQDGSFIPVNWTIFSGNGAHNTSQELLGGNPGAWRRSNHLGGPTPIEITHRLITPGQEYDPSTQGAITSLDASWDHLHVSPGFSQERFVVIQGGILYRTETQSFGGADWEPSLFEGLVESDFTDVNGNAPSFGESGGPISFGYARRTPATDASIVHGIDNFRVVVRTGGGGGDPGRIRFPISSDVAENGSNLIVRVERVGGNQGVVTATILYTEPSGGALTFDLTWLNGDDGPKTYTLVAAGPAAAIGSARLRITSVAGGASIGERDEMVVLVYPTDWAFEPLALSLLLLFAGLSPAFVLLLIVPTVVLAARRTRTRVRLVRKDRAAGVLGVVVLTAGLPSCVPSSQVEPGNAPDMVWNDRLRLDGQPLAENSRDCVDADLACLQRGTDPWVGHYETRDQNVLSEIYPDLRTDLETHRLPKSDCLWIPDRQPMRASWEAVLGLDPTRQLGKAILNGLPEMDDDVDARYGQEFYPGGLRWFSFCRMNTPYGRDWLTVSQPGVCEGIEDECPECQPGPYWTTVFDTDPGVAFSIGCQDPNPIPMGQYVRRVSVFDMDLRAAAYPDPRPGHNLCAPAAPGPSDASVTGWLGANCPVENALADVCGDKCLIQPDRDATLSVTSLYYQRTRVLSPSLMTVRKSEPRRLVRPTQKPAAAYVWSTPLSPVRNDAGPPSPEAPGLRWVENFTPDLRVSQARVLRIDAAGVETPLAPSRLRVLDPVGNGSVWECAGQLLSDGSRVFKLLTSTACRKGDGPLGPLAATPTYLIANVTAATAPPLRAPLTWQADLAGSIPASQVFIELLLENQACTAQGCNALKAEAAEKDLGRLQVSRPHRSLLEVTNVGPEPLRVSTVRMEVVPGQVDARADFGLEVLCCPRGVPAPVELDAAGLLAISGDFAANPLVQASTSGQPAFLRPLDTPGARITVQGHTLEAAGDPRFEEQRITYTDPAASFSWAPSAALGRRVFGETVYRRRALPFDVDPGHSFWVRVTTAPRGYGNRQARLRVSGTAASNPAIPVAAETLLKVNGIAGPSLTYLPRVLSFPLRRLDASGQPQDVWELNAMAANYGGVDMQRTSVSITGPDAGRFHLVSSHAPTHTIPAGHDEVFLVGHTTSCAPPQATATAYGPRQYEAQLKITTNGGEAVVQLRAEWCPQLGP